MFGYKFGVPYKVSKVVNINLALDIQTKSTLWKGSRLEYMIFLTFKSFKAVGGKSTNLFVKRAHINLHLIMCLHTSTVLKKVNISSPYVYIQPLNYRKHPRQHCSVISHGNPYTHKRVSRQLQESRKRPHQLSLENCNIRVGKY